MVVVVVAGLSVVAVVLEALLVPVVVVSVGLVLLQLAGLAVVVQVWEARSLSRLVL